MRKTSLFLLTILTCAFLVNSHRDQDDSQDSQGYSYPRSVSLSLAVSQCTMNYIEGPGTSFSFTNCIYQNTSSSNWSICFAKCCDETSLSKYSWPSDAAVDYCEDINSVGNDMVKIVLGVLAALFGLGIILLCIYCCLYRGGGQTTSRRQSSEFEAYQSKNMYVKPQEPQYIPWREEKQINSKKGKYMSWSSLARIDREIMNSGQNCAVCLDGDATAQLDCGHQYHPKCIGDWLRRSKGCPCCRRQNTSRVKIFCCECRWRYYVCSRKLMRDTVGDLPLRCKECQQGKVDKCKGMNSYSKKVKREMSMEYMS